jgi:hypothetical protein
VCRTAGVTTRQGDLFGFGALKGWATGKRGYATDNLGLDPEDAPLVQPVRQKLAVPGNSPVDVSETRFSALSRQLDARLKTVLRYEEFQAFDLGRSGQLSWSLLWRNIWSDA